METMINGYREAVKAHVDRCTDVSLLDFVLKLIKKSDNGDKNKGAEIVGAK